VSAKNLSWCKQAAEALLAAIMKGYWPVFVCADIDPGKVWIMHWTVRIDGFMDPNKKKMWQSTTSITAGQSTKSNLLAHILTCDMQIHNAFSRVVERLLFASPSRGGRYSLALMPHQGDPVNNRLHRENRGKFVVQ
jgi:hypothetical protein